MGDQSVAHKAAEAGFELATFGLWARI